MSGELRYLAIEGPIGAGSTTLAERISERLGHETVLDPHDENPFLRDFYEDPQLFALKTQLSFFRLRWEQQKQINRTMTPGKEGNGTGKIITDYLFARDELFARMTLTDAEFEIYDYFVTQIAPRPTKPDLVIYLQANATTLQRRIAGRARKYEENIPIDYLQRLIEVYNHYFFHYKETPLLVINTTEIDYVNNELELEYLIDEIHRTKSGTRYYVASVEQSE